MNFEPDTELIIRKQHRESPVSNWTLFGVDLKTGRRLNQQSSAVWNRRLVLQLLRKHRKLSRRQLAKITGLRDSTLTYIVRDLMESEIIKPAGKRDSKTVGQKQILLEINADAGWTLGVDVRKNSATLIIQTIAGDSWDMHQIPLPDDIHVVAETVKSELAVRFRKIGRPTGRFLGMGVGVPGVVDATRGKLMISRDFNCREVELGSLFEKLFGVPVIVEHNANCAALAEARIGAAADMSSFLYFLIHHTEEEGQIHFKKAYGCALYLDGRLYRGVNYAAGEIDEALQPMHHYFSVEPDAFEALLDEAGSLTDEMEDLAKRIGCTVAHLFNLIDPSAVIVGGDFELRNRAFVEAIRKGAAKELIPIEHRHARIMPNALGELAVATGAAIAAAERALIESVSSDTN